MLGPAGASRAEDKPAPAPESPPQVSEGPSAAQLHHAAEAMAAGAGFTEADMAALKAMMSDLKGAAASAPLVGTNYDMCCFCV